MGSEPLSRIEKILSNIVGEGSYELELPLSDAEEILQAILNDTTTDIAARDRMCEILLCILNNEEYTGETLSRAEEILKCISQGEKYEVDEWTYEHVLSRVEKLLTDWANKEDPEYTKTVSGILIHVLDAVEKPADSLIVSMSPKQEAEPWIDSTPDTEPYLSRIIPRGNRSSREFHGGTVAWNQLCRYDKLGGTSNGLTTTVNTDNSITVSGKATNVYANMSAVSDRFYFKVEKNHKIMISAETNNASIHVSFQCFDSSLSNTVRIDTVGDTGANTVNGLPRIIGLTVNEEYNIIITSIFLCDLTQMFANNPAIADYVYSLEQATAGAGVAWLKSHGFIDDEYHGYDPGSLKSVNISALKIIDTDLTEHTYPLTSTNLRGVFKLDAQNKLSTDGDIYASDGTITRNYEEITSFTRGALDSLGELYNIGLTTTSFTTTPKAVSNYFPIVSLPAVRRNAALGIKSIAIYGTKIYIGGFVGSETALDNLLPSLEMVVETTPTTETALAFTNPQIIEAGGREEFVDSRDVKVPVGNSTIYSAEYEIEGYDNLTVYHAQNEQAESPTEYSISFALQGDVYSGTFDIVTGVLSINMAEVDLGSLNWYSSSSKANTFYAAAPSDSKPATSSLTTRIIETQVVCDKYAQVPIYDLIYDASVKNKIAFCNLNGTGVGYQRLYVNNVMYSDAAVFKTAMNGTKCVYELAEPQTYQLTAQEVQMLLGENTLWTDDNLNLQLTYKGSNPAMMMQSLRAQNNILKKQGLKPIEEPLKPLDPIKPIIKK